MSGTASTTNTASTKKVPSWLLELNAAKSTKTQLTPEQQQKLDAAKAYAKQITEELLPQKPKLIAQAIQAAVKKRQEELLKDLSIFSRIYVGSVNFDITEQDLKDVFSTFGHIKSMAMSYEATESRHKGFCFIDFDTPEAATLAIQTMDSAVMGGRNIKVGRPSNFPLDGNKCLPAAPKTRVFIANVNEYLTEEDVKKLFDEVLVVKQIALVPDSSGRKHKGYGYIEFEKEADATLAVQTFHGYSFADKKLRLIPCIVNMPFPRGMSLKRRLSDGSSSKHAATSEQKSVKSGK